MWRFVEFVDKKMHLLQDYFQVVKNIVLAGVNLTIQDSGVVTFDELAYNFFLNVDDIGKQVRLPNMSCFVSDFCFYQIATTVLPRVKELNSFASVDCNTSTLDDLDDIYFTQFSVILMSGCSEVPDCVNLDLTVFECVLRRRNPCELTICVVSAVHKQCSFGQMSSAKRLSSTRTLATISNTKMTPPPRQLLPRVAVPPQWSSPSSRSPSLPCTVC